MEVIKELCNITLPEDFNIKYINENEFNERDINKAIALYKKDLEENSYKELGFTIYSNPKACKRAIVLKTHTFDPNVSIKQDIRIEIFRQLKELGYDNFTPATGEVILEMKIFKSIPKSMPKYKKLLAEAGILLPLSKPDFDDYVKLLCDAINSILFVDDAQIVVGVVNKYYSFTPRFEFTIKFKELNMF